LVGNNILYKLEVTAIVVLKVLLLKYCCITSPDITMIMDYQLEHLPNHNFWYANHIMLHPTLYASTIMWLLNHRRSKISLYSHNNVHTSILIILRFTFIALIKLVIYYHWKINVVKRCFKMFASKSKKSRFTWFSCKHIFRLLCF
jgi:hypothetical protein